MASTPSAWAIATPSASDNRKSYRGSPAIMPLVFFLCGLMTVSYDIVLLTAFAYVAFCGAAGHRIGRRDRNNEFAPWTTPSSLFL